MKNNTLFTWACALFVVLLMALFVLLAGCTPTPAMAQGVTGTHETKAETVRVAVLPLVLYGPEMPPPTATPAPVWPPRNTTICTVSGGSVNVRYGVGMSYPVVDVAYKGEELTAWGTEVDGWQKVITPRGIHGWFLVSRWCR